MSRELTIIEGKRKEELRLGRGGKERGYEEED